jgi:hypothetical protein
MTPAPNPQLNIQQIVDIYARQNFQNLAAYFAAQNQLLNFGFKEVVFTGAENNFAIAHGLPAAPLDIIVTHISGPGKATFLFGDFDAQNMYITTTGACRLRFFFGTYYNYQSSDNTNSTDAMSFQGA